MKTRAGYSDRQKGRIRYDAVLKDLFQRDHSILLDRFTRGIPIIEALNIEFTAVEERRSDLLFRLSDGSILHIEFQSVNDPRMVFRMGRYICLIGERYRCRVRQIVLYTGLERLRMAARADLGDTILAYELHDIREFESDDLLRSGRPGDYALALLASGGDRNLHRILLQAAKLPPHARGKMLMQLKVFSGLRKLEDRLKMEVNQMGTALYIKDHGILREIHEKGFQEGEAKGEAKGLIKGEAKGMAIVLAELLRSKFGSLPRWANARLRGARPAQLERWAKKVLTADSIEAVLGPRTKN